MNDTPALSEKDQLLVDWRKAKQALIIATDTERELRDKLAKMFFPVPKKGTQRIDIGFGYNLKLVRTIRYTLDKDREKIDKALADISALGNEGSFITGRLVKWKPELSVTEYESLAEPYKKIIDTVLTSKDGAPSLEIEAPKEKK